MRAISDFNIAVSDFRRFLAGEGHPDDLFWVFRDDLWWRGPDHVLVRYPPPPENPLLAEKVYDEGRERGLAEMKALATAGGRTAATVWFPKYPEEEVQGWSQGVKLVIRQPLPEAKAVSGLAWHIIRRLPGYRRYQRDECVIGSRFCIRGVRYRSAVPEARTKFEAERAETEAKQAVFEGRYGRPTGEHEFAKFVGNPDAEKFQFEEGTFLAWAKENKRSWRHDVFRARALVGFFRGKTFAQISPLLVEKFKSERRRSTITFKEKPERDRSVASVNRDLELLSRIFTLAIERGLTDSNPCSKVRRC